MRETTARGLAVATGGMVFAAVALFAVLQERSALAEDVVVLPSAPANVEDVVESERPVVQDSILRLGRAVYDAEGCSGCHSIAGAGSPRSPLDGVGDRLTPEEIRLWIVDPRSADPNVRKPAFSHLSEGEIEALVAYLASLR